MSQDQLEELKEALGANEVEEYARLFNLAKYPARTLAFLMRREFVSLESTFAATYFDKNENERPEGHTVTANISTVRRLLFKKYQIKIHNKSGAGWWLSEPDKMKIRGIMDSLREGHEPGGQPVESVYLIEHDIPVPPIRGRSKYPYAQLAVGNSFFVKSISPVTMLANASNWKKANKSTFKFTVRKMPGGVRVWRIE